jgi:hypothetical protein
MKMTTYENLLTACIAYFQENGATRETCDKLETMLPGAWAAELIADALDVTAEAEDAMDCYSCVASPLHY